MTDVILPCLNEAAALPWVLSRIPPGCTAIVADNGSTDDSAAVARDHGAVVVPVPRRGFGAAAHAGLCAATAEIVCFADADGSCDPAQLPDLLAPLLDHTADLVLGRRVPTDRTAWPTHARYANALLARRLRRRYRVPVRDLGPMRAGWRRPLLSLGLTDRRFGYPLEMVLRAAHAGWQLREIDVDYRPRAAGTRSKVTGTLLGSARAVRDMSRIMRALPAGGVQ
ncbi:glycosyl transferase [Actinocatenispora thailandica]|uniref:Glycosyl transferase n=1 Tax=Actinocatenispora thailandica TaxID=227318 RepID=A0A7R7HVY0_9ACTN|nr:glycosyltransferase [Actinocatenispora thailandica]BCJ33364.1 glycosyl transferase [Actinocatenispora thailandica]